MPLLTAAVRGDLRAAMEAEVRDAATATGTGRGATAVASAVAAAAPAAGLVSALGDLPQWVALALVAAAAVVTLAIVLTQRVRPA